MTIESVAITAGSGTEIAVDRINIDGGNKEFQIVKLGIGADGALDTLVDSGQQTGANSIPVVLASDVSLPAPGTGATSLGKAEDAAHASGDTGVMMLGVVNDANADLAGTDGDYVPPGMSKKGHVMTYRMADLQRISVQSSGLTTATTAYTAGDQVGTQFTIAGAARVSGGGGVITGVVLISAADIIGAYDVAFTDSSITLASDNAAYAISDADSLKLVGLAQLVGAYDIGNNRIAQAFGLAIPYVCSGGTSLYASLLTRFGHTFFGATTDLQLIVYVERY